MLFTIKKPCHVLKSNDHQYDGRLCESAMNKLRDEIDKNESQGEINIRWKHLKDRYNQLVAIDEKITQELRVENVGQEGIDEEYDFIQEYKGK